MLMLKQYASKQRGFSLVELMISVTIGMVVLAGIAQIFVSTVNSNGDTLKMARVNQDLRAAMDVMIRDIRRAGYDSQATNRAPVAVGNPLAVANPFTQGVNNLQVTGSCITYTYDSDNDGTVNDQDKFAFYLSNGAILMRNSGSDASNSCPPGTAEGITDSNRVTITALSFNISSSCIDVTASPPTDCAATTPPANDILVMPRQVAISITGKPAGDTSGTMSRTITDTVRLRNDLVCIKGSTPCP